VDAGRLLPDGLRQIGNRDFATFRDEHRALDGVFELADIAGPAIADEEVIHRRRQRLHVLLIPLTKLLQEVIAQQGDVFRPLAERRHTQRDRC
jgi:hypothetical protein